MENRVKFFVVGIFLSTFCNDCSTLKQIDIKVPPAVVQGHKAILKCTFDLETDKLYSVKWYRGAGEFYRYTPSESNPIKQFKIRGFHVLESESNATQVVLEDVTRAISGPFSCEVTADQPSFFTDMKTADLEVVELPKKDPYITGLKIRYRIGDILKANCTSEKSSPAANLAWYVNGQHWDGPHVHKYKNQDGSYVTSYSTLRLKINEELFANGKLKIRCSASMHHVYHRSQEKSIELERRKHKSHAWPATTTTTTIQPPAENWRYSERNQQEPTLMHLTPTGDDAGKTHPHGQVLLLLLVSVVPFFR